MPDATVNDRLKIVGPALPYMPREDGSAESYEGMQRCGVGPVAPRGLPPTSDPIFDPVAVHCVKD